VRPPRKDWKITTPDEAARDEVAYWSSRPVAERLAAVETPRQLTWGIYGDDTVRMSEFIGSLCAARVLFLIVGAHALAVHGRPRAGRPQDLVDAELLAASPRGRRRYAGAGRKK